MVSALVLAQVLVSQKRIAAFLRQPEHQLGPGCTHTQLAVGGDGRGAVRVDGASFCHSSAGRGKANVLRDISMQVSS